MSNKDIKLQEVMGSFFIQSVEKSCYRHINSIYVVRMCQIIDYAFLVWMRKKIEKRK